MLRVLWAISLAVYAEAQRHNFDKRCPAAATLDLAGQQRDPSSESSYLFTTLAAGSTVQDCVIACCGDWSCVSFAFYTPDAAARPADCKPSGPCCVFKDDLDALVKANASSGVVTGKRAHLAAKQPPYPASKLSATVHKELTVRRRVPDHVGSRRRAVHGRRRQPPGSRQHGGVATLLLPRGGRADRARLLQPTNAPQPALAHVQEHHRAGPRRGRQVGGLDQGVPGLARRHP